MWLTRFRHMEPGGRGMQVVPRVVVFIFKS